MEHAKTRNSTINFISRHLVACAHQALMRTRQTVVAKSLQVADSTVLRRSERFPEIMEVLAGCGVEDFVMKGEKKIPIEQYRWLMKMAVDWGKHELEMSQEKSPELVEQSQGYRS
jgi:hypothetical protein